MAELINVFVSYGDGGDRSRGPIIGVWTKEKDAILHQKGSGWYGGDGGYGQGKAIVMDNGDAYLVDEHKHNPIDLDGKKGQIIEKAKAKALAKLTKEEKELLGLKE